jgi:putative sterol carrier protein
MPIDFPSEEWTKAYEDAINGSAEYKEAGKTWTHGPLALVVTAEPSIGLEADTAFILDLHEGVCRKCWISDMEEASKQPFVISGNYAQWKQVMRKELDPIKGMMQGKLKLKGNLPVIVRFVKAAQVLVECTSLVDTHFLDE